MRPPEDGWLALVVEAIPPSSEDESSQGARAARPPQRGSARLAPVPRSCGPEPYELIVKRSRQGARFLGEDPVNSAQVLLDLNQGLPVCSLS